MTDRGGGVVSGLARQLAAHQRWEWRPGMADTDGNRVIAGHTGRAIRWSINNEYEVAEHVQTLGLSPSGGLPDLSDAATCGALWRMLRDHWAAESYYSHRLELICDPEGDCIVDLVWEEPSAGVEVTERLAEEATEGEALAAALLAVWGAE